MRKLAEIYKNNYKEVVIMAGVVVFGAQWGDEGKGRFVDMLADGAHMVIRYQGGNNAGHTVWANGVEYKLHLIPSGILFPEKPCLIANGVVLDPKALLKEIKYVNDKGIEAKNLYISDRCHLIMPYHRELDALIEQSLGDAKIGTTKRGIGPCYTDKVARVGIRTCDLLDEKIFAEKLKVALKSKNDEMTKLYGAPPMDFDEIFEEYMGYAKVLAPMICDTSLMAYEAQKAGKNLLFEGAQGMLLDIDFGTYPYVTSSHPTSGGVSIGVGVGPQAVNEVVGVVKAYTTRVGEGPFVTELLDEKGEQIRTKGGEFGVSTGRPRRCGWLDTVILRFAVRTSGISTIALSRLDTLGGTGDVKVCTGYELDGKFYDNYPASLEMLARCKPVYEEFEGWSDDISHIRNFEDLPVAAQKYVNFVEKCTGVDVSMIGVGPHREQCVVRRNIF